MNAARLLSRTRCTYVIEGEVDGQRVPIDVPENNITNEETALKVASMLENKYGFPFLVREVML